MPVNLIEPAAGSLHPVAGITFGSAAAGIRKNGRDDVLVALIEPGASAAGVFTRNRFCAAPVILCREHLQRQANGIRAIVVNAGNANAGTGAQGLAAARQTCEAMAALIGCEASAILPMSTGVILEPLPVDRLTAALPAARQSASADHWLVAARTIMTTDTVPKAVSRRLQIDGRTVTINGIVKGAGMIRPDMGTMLSIVATDAAIPADLLTRWVREAADQSFNRITVDGDTSTNDSLLVVATGKSGVSADQGSTAIRETLFEVTRKLAQDVIRDGEGATKFVTITVEQAANLAEASAVAYAIAHSPLVKTAFFASDPNLGRLLCAIGYAGIDDLDVNKVSLLLDDVLVASDGGRHPSYREEAGKRVLSQAEFGVTVRLARGTVATTVWTCDLSHDYVSINADYRS